MSLFWLGSGEPLVILEGGGGAVGDRQISEER
jgi:hypothetical protein